MPEDETVAAIRDVSEWFAITIRVTGFVSSAEDLGTLPIDQWWQSVAGNPPRERAESVATGESSRFGDLGGATLQLRTTFDRVDWILHFPQPVPLSGFSAVKFLDALTAIQTIGRKWFEHPEAPTCWRLALSGDLRLPVPDRDSGYRQLQPYLNQLTIDPEGSSDLRYQINRRRKSPTIGENATVNRLSSWGVVGLSVQRNLPEHRMPKSHATMATAYFCQLEFDINTPPEEELELSSKNAEVVLEVFSDLAIEIAAKGDVK